MEYRHCCNLMSEFLEENKVTIGYSKRFRSYYLHLKSSKIASQTISYCPWCGTKLSNLHAEYDKAISKLLNISLEDIDEVLYDPFDNSNLPKEFQTDEWWKKRGL